MGTFWDEQVYNLTPEDLELQKSFKYSSLGIHCIKPYCLPEILHRFLILQNLIQVHIGIPDSD
ncbi:hypothetical protein YC2023_011226 [Brassica napus]